MIPKVLKRIEPKKGMVIASTQDNSAVSTIDDECPTLTSAMGAGGGQIPMIIEEVEEDEKL